MNIMKIPDRRELQGIPINHSFGKIDKNKYLTGEKILPHLTAQNNRKSKFTDSPFGNDLKSKQKRLKINDKNKWKL